MEEKCIRCGRKMGLLSLGSLNLRNGQVLCESCAEMVRENLSKLYAAKSIDEFKKIKRTILNDCKKSSDAKTVSAVCNLLNCIEKEKISSFNVQVKQGDEDKEFIENTEKFVEENPVMQNDRMEMCNTIDHETGMFSNVGKKIKILAKVITWINIIGSIIVGIDLMASEMVLVGILVWILGPLFSWISSFITYGFGHLIENTDEIIRNLKK